MQKKLINNNYIFFFLIIIISSLVSFTYYFEQLALQSAFYISQLIKYPDQNNPFYLSTVNSPSVLFHIISAMLKIGVSHEIISKLILFLATLFNATGIFLISRYLTNSKSLSLLITFVLIFLRKNFGHIDYPTLMFTEHTNGMISLSLCTLIFGLITLRNLSVALFVNIILITIHPVMGLWMLMIISLSILLNNFQRKNIIQINNLLYYFLIFTFILMLYFYYVNDKSLPYDYDPIEYKIYFDYIEAHRTNYGYLKNLNWNYISKTLFLSFIILIYLFKTNGDKKFFFQTVLLSIFLSFFLYLTYKYFSEIYPEIIIRTIPQRFFLTHSVIGYAIIISIAYKLLSIFFKKKNYDVSYYLIFIILAFHLLQHHSAFTQRTNMLLKNEIYIQDEKKFWSDAKKNFIPSGLGITSNNLCNNVTLYLKKPLLICFEFLDYIPYFPELAKPTRKIVKGILDLDYEEIPTKHLGGIVDNDLRQIFQRKSKIDWTKIKEEFNVSFLIFPNNWNINLRSHNLGSKYKIYILD